jgi:hypothetical protein
MPVIFVAFVIVGIPCAMSIVCEKGRRGKDKSLTSFKTIKRERQSPTHGKWWKWHNCMFIYPLPDDHHQERINCGWKMASEWNGNKIL